jgi:hypothetical protein
MYVSYQFNPETGTITLTTVGGGTVDISIQRLIEKFFKMKHLTGMRAPTSVIIEFYEQIIALATQLALDIFKAEPIGSIDTMNANTDKVLVAIQADIDRMADTASAEYSNAIRGLLSGYFTTHLLAIKAAQRMNGAETYEKKDCELF